MVWVGFLNFSLSALILLSKKKTAMVSYWLNDFQMCRRSSQALTLT